MTRVWTRSPHDLSTPEGRRAYQREWRKVNPKRLSAYRAAERDKYVPRRASHPECYPSRFCRECGIDITQRSLQATYCSSTCAARYRWRTRYHTDSEWRQREQAEWRQRYVETQARKQWERFRLDPTYRARVEAYAQRVETKVRLLSVRHAQQLLHTQLAAVMQTTEFREWKSARQRIQKKNYYETHKDDETYRESRRAARLRYEATLATDPLKRARRMALKRAQYNRQYATDTAYRERRLADNALRSGFQTAMGV